MSKSWAVKRPEQPGYEEKPANVRRHKWQLERLRPNAILAESSTKGECRNAPGRSLLPVAAALRVSTGRRQKVKKI